MGKKRLGKRIKNKGIRSSKITAYTGESRKLYTCPGQTYAQK